jgi:hypothetical protein
VGRTQDPAAFFLNKKKETKKFSYIPLPLQILHISEADVLETKMFGSSPIIILRVSELVVC